MMPKISRFVILLLVVSCSFSQILAAKEDVKQWNGSARIAGKGNHRYKAFFLNEQVYENSQPDLADLRIVDQNQEFVPYIIVNGYATQRENQTIYDAQLIKEFTKDGNTTFDFQINPLLKTADIMGNQLKLILPNQNFLKNVEVYGGYDANAWEVIGQDQLYRVDDLIKDRILLGDVEKFTYYRVIVLNNTDHIELENLKLIHDNIKKDWSDFQQTAQLHYQIQNQSNETTITIRNPQHLKMKRIALTVTGNFRRTYQVFADPAMKQMINSGEIFHLNFQDLNISETSIDLAVQPWVSSILKLRIINYDNRPLQIEKIQTEYYIDQIVFEDLGNQDYHLFFGNLSAKQPIYDLESFKTHILNEPMNLLSLTDFKITKLKTVPLKSKPNLNLIFNIVISTITLLLIVFLVRKLNRQKTN